MNKLIASEKHYRVSANGSVFLNDSFIGLIRVHSFACGASSLVFHPDYVYGSFVITGADTPEEIIRAIDKISRLDYPKKVCFTLEFNAIMNEASDEDLKKYEHLINKKILLLKAEELIRAESF